VNFDVIGDEFLLVYSGRNTIRVYDLSWMRLDVAYKMTLPLYRDFETYEFFTYKDHSMQFKSIVRSSHSNIFSCLMQDPTTGKTGIFIYSLEASQHNTFVMQQDMSEQFIDPQLNPRLISIGDEEGRKTIGVFSDSQIRLFDAQYLNLLVLNEEKIP
jgi:hypothetical protein